MKSRPATSRRDHFWRWARRGAAAAGILLPLVSISLTLLLLSRPSWYQPRSIDFNRLDQDKQAVWRLADEIGRALAGGKPLTLTLSEADLNRWIAARGELWPDQEALRLPGAESPMVRLREGGVIGLAATAASGAVRCVASVDLRIAVTEQHLELSLTGAGLGRLPVPGAVLRRALASTPAAERLSADGERIIVPNEFEWKNGKRRFRLSAVRVDAGEVQVTLTPRP